MAGFNENNDEIISSINVTPLVDIMLVLLIIFMLVSTIVNTPAIEVQLPHAATGEEVKNESVAVMISQTGDFYLAGAKINSFAVLTEELKRRKAENPNVQVIISADRKVYHEEVIKLVDTLRIIGIYKFAISVEPLAVPEKL